MLFMLDTSAYSAWMRGHLEITDLLAQAGGIVVSPIILGELGAGFRNGIHRRKNERELHDFLNSPRVSIADVDRETAVRYAEILHSLKQAGTPIPTNDIWIAASAMQHGLCVLTTDTHFREVPQILVEFCEPH